ncbi:2Fe-2S iron-sulfur cluster binding domain-containing protein [Sphingomonas sp.]|uniref:2Fe-2S iron-sulfur cluster-binding protein n=1 Tax=Sphingomonas sp. TaxID=28214 RepID=UPI002CF2CC67|nr:2Fe-2S iron-sulfur cluster binding domain-containing protein [Sphingomonas sp.]HWK35444.1 2Fe-2S iron-sulfur cluster binding domain-containing protein [Sphingomonas sp.]
MTAPPADFVVRLARSGATVAVGPADTILRALARAGVHIPHNCTAGICGICETRVLAGEPLHRDQIIDRCTTGARHRIMPCCSRSRSAELVLDL